MFVMLQHNVTVEGWWSFMFAMYIIENIII